MRGETVAEGGRKHACPVGVSKIRARRSVESLLKRPLAEILSSTAPAVVLVKEKSRRSTAPVAKEVSRRRKPHRSMISTRPLAAPAQRVTYYRAYSNAIALKIETAGSANS